MTDIIDTSGFYRVVEGELQHAPTFAHGPGYSIHRTYKDLYPYPTDGGWMWFETEDEANTFFGIVA